MRKALLLFVALAVVGGGAFVVYSRREATPKFAVVTAPVTRGDIVESVGATGTLQAVKTVQVGTQVSGTIQALYADFNSLVKKGQVLARLDPSLFQTQIEQARANLIRAQADLERLKVNLDDARTKLDRAKELSGRQLIPKSELDTADVNVRSADAQLRSAEAQVTQARASLNQNEVNLQHTVIEAPIDGLVISRSVDVGQTVAASMQAPTIFILAADLTEMQVIANLDESDVGRIRPHQAVSFRVDAYPTEDFFGTVSQVRLQPTVQQNVVTYATVIDVPNKQLKLKPGMTANVNIEIARSSNVLRIPNAALRFRPTNEMYAAIGQTPPEAGQRVDRPAGNISSAAPASASPGPAAPVTDAASANTPSPAVGTSGSSRNRFAGRMQNLSAEERAAMRQRFGDRGGNAAAADAGTTRAADRRTSPDTPSPDAARSGGASTIDALFGPLPRVESQGRVWLYENNQLKPMRVRLGISDGQMTELVEGELKEDTAVVANVTTGGETRPAATSTFPLLGQPTRGQFPAGGFQGGGNRNVGGGGR